ncbi:MAG: hypothetical protein AVO35_05855 [Candidatus Aegiribacteria sp. MLS_C]|nr:MAG: hypothetical protein AVO35_05855 [Candidatus Aegiribacteria sp. MLS_C]
MHVPGGGYRLFYLSDETGACSIFSAFSADGVIWTVEGEVALGWPSGSGIGNPTASAEGDSAMVMSYDRFFGLGGYSARSVDGGAGWDRQMLRTNQKGRLDRIIRHSDGTYLCGWQETGGGTIVSILASHSWNLVDWAPAESLTTNDNGHDPMPFEDGEGVPWVYYLKHSGTVYEVMRRRVAPWGTCHEEEPVRSGVHNATQTHPLLLSDGRVALFRGEWWDGYDQSDVMMEILDFSGTAHGPPDTSGLRLEVGPNPFDGVLAVTVHAFPSFCPRLEVFDLSGRLVDILAYGKLWQAASALHGPPHRRFRPGSTW